MIIRREKPATKYFRDLTNKRFGKLLVLKKVKKQNKTQFKSYWKCLCDCGNISYSDSTRLLKRNYKSCGCQIGNPLGPHESFKNEIYQNYKRAAKHRNFSFNLSKSYFLELIKQNCYYCDSKPLNTFSKRNKNFSYNGVDRLINSNGYSKKNCVTCCRICNRIKMNLNEDEFMNKIKEIYEFKYKR